MQDIPSHIKELLPFGGKFALADIQSVSAEVLDRLSDEEKQELESLRNLKRQQEYATSRLLIKKLAQNLGADPNVFCIQKDDLGQPFGKAEEKHFCVSIAHTNKMVFGGITEGKSIGIDLEPTDREVPSKLKPRILHPDEKELFFDMETIRLWTIKEAYIKLRGQGLRLNMNQVHVQQQKDDFFVELNNDKTAKICSFRHQSNWLAIAYYQ